MTPLQPNGWARCPAGELGRLAGRLRARRLRGLLLAAAGGLIAAGGIAYGAVRVVSTLSGGSPPPACHPAPCGSQTTPEPCPSTSPSAGSAQP
jgi:hypothetical protein